MKYLLNVLRVLPTLPALSCLVCAPAVWADTNTDMAAAQQQQLYDLPLDDLLRVQIPPQADVGSRTGTRTAQEAMVPVDVYSAEQLLSVGRMGLTQALVALVPGFNAPRPSIADGTDHAPPFTLRSLNPDQVLVLVNGKRQHQSSLLHNNGTIGRGSSGVDLDAIPLLAVERVEVLRDGAAAQYGSDAIAGIINIVLKGYGHSSQALTGWGRTTQGDGIQRQAALLHSIALAGDGFINLSAQWNDRGSSNRARPDPRDGGRTNIHFGDADTQDALLAWNAELPQGDTTWYAHGYANQRHSSAGAFFRYADSDRNVPSIYPEGFVPVIEPRIQTLSATLGARGLSSGGTQWDVAYTGGMNNFHFYVNNSLNRSLGANSPTTFDSGSTALIQHMFNADVSHAWGPHTVSGGYEFRREDYRIRAGELASYTLGPDSGWYSGAQGFGGFSPDNAVQAQRTSQALYLDMKYAVQPQLVLNAAVRAEHYSDFGSTVNGKLALRWRPVEHWLLRAALSNGFRAPSLMQSYFTSTAMVQEGDVLMQYGRYRVDHPVARALGSTDLRPEKSRHASVGAVWQPHARLTASVDGFMTDIRDRIMSTGDITNWNVAQLSPEAQALLRQYQVDGASYFTNAVNTRTQGFDVRVDFKQEWHQGRRWHGSLAYQRAATKITGGTAPSVPGLDMAALILDPSTRITMEAGQPKTALKLWAQYSTPRYDLALNVNRFGSYASTNGEHKAVFAANWTLDAQLSYRWSKNTTISVGGTNILNTRPSEWGISYDGVTGAGKPIRYSQYAPIGYNGAAYYVRLGMRF